MTSQKGCNRSCPGRRMAPTSLSEAPRRPPTRPAACQSTSRNKATSYKTDRESSSQGQLLEIVLDEIRKLNVPAQNRLPKAHASSTSDKFVARLVELEHESELTASTLEHVIGSVDALLTSRRGAKFGPQSVSALRAVAAALNERLESLSAANCDVRSELLHREEAEAALQMSVDQRDTLLKQNAELKAMNKRFQNELIEKEESIRELQSSLEEAMHEKQLLTENRSSISGLTRQLQQKESDSNRKAIQIQQLESDLAQTRIDANHICAHLRDSLAKAEEAKIVLKRVARAHKDRSTRMASEVEKLQHLLLEKEPLLEQLVEEEEEEELLKMQSGEEEFMDETTSHALLRTARSLQSQMSNNSLKETSPPHPVTEEERRAYNGLVDLHKEECSRAEQRLRSMEIRLRTSEDRNRSMANQLSETSSLLESVRTELREKLQNNTQEEGRLTEVEAELESIRRERDVLQGKVAELQKTSQASAGEQRLRDRLSSLEAETARLRASADLERQLRESAERQSAQRAAQLREADASQRGLEQHLELLKKSYNKCFEQ